MRVGSMFSGIGGLDLGLERAGMEVVWQAEIDPYCCSVLAKHWPTVPNLGDVRSIDWRTVEPVDLIAGGFPCQPVSQNGHQLVELDPRWLWPAFADAVRHLRPSWVLVENVADLAVRGLDTVATDLAALRYDAEWTCVPAAALGAPHRRERTFLVAYPDGLGCEAGPRVFTRHPEAGVGESTTWRSVPRRGHGGRVRRWPDPDVLGVVDGPPTELDGARLRAIGNGVVPAVAEFVARLIIAADAGLQALEAAG